MNAAYWKLKFSSTNFKTLKYLDLRNYRMNFVENCKVYFKQLPVNEINGNSDKFSGSYNAGRHGSAVTQIFSSRVTFFYRKSVSHHSMSRSFHGTERGDVWLTNAAERHS